MKTNSLSWNQVSVKYLYPSVNDKEQLHLQNAQTYNDLVSTIDKQIAITKTYKNIIEIRQRLRSQDDPDQAHHCLIVELEDDT